MPEKNAGFGIILRMRPFLPIALLCVPALLAAGWQLFGAGIDRFYSAYLLLAVAGLLPAVLLWRKGETPVPPARFPLPGGAVFLLGIFLMAIPMLMVNVARRIHGVIPGQEAGPETVVLAASLAAPFQIALLLAMQSMILSPAGFRIGWKRQSYGFGFLAWFAATPCVFAIFLAVLHFTPAPDKHAFEKAREGASGGFLAMMILQTVLLTPLVEEWFFRGVVLRCQCYAEPEVGDRVPMPSLIVLVIAMMFASMGSQAILGLLFIASTMAFAFALRQSDWLARRSVVRREDWFAIAANASLFAAVHGAVWPSPVPLFFLSCVLGWLTIRTGGFLAAVVAHALFNAVSCLAPYLG